MSRKVTVDYSEDYVVRYGGDKSNRTDYMNKKEAIKKFKSIKLDKNIRWKELIYEPLNEEERQDIIMEEEVKVVNVLGVDVVIPNN